MQQTPSTKKSIFNRLSTQICLLTRKSLNSEMKEPPQLGKKNWREQSKFQSTSIQNPSFSSSSSSFFNSKLFNTGLEKREYGENWQAKGELEHKEVGGRMNKQSRICGRTDGIVGRELKMEGIVKKGKEIVKKKGEERKWNAKINEKERRMESKGRREAEGEGMERGGRVEGVGRRGLWRKEEDFSYGNPFLYCAASARISLNNGFEEYERKMQKRLKSNPFMSGFKDTFTRNEGNEGNLQYDDTAFHFFFLTILSILLIPLLISLFLQIISDPLSEQIKRMCDCDFCQKNKEKFKKTMKKNKLTKGFFIKLLFTLLLIFLLSSIIEKISESPKAIKSFDPYEILEVAPTASQNEIKKAYRKLILKYHPDKNPDDPQATAKFILITKAHDCLTDEKAKANCEKFGNPDGQGGAFQVAIALPSFLLKKENHVAVLAVFFLFLLVIIPGTVIVWYENSKKYDLDGSLMDDKKFFYQKLNENLLPKNIPELLSQAIEFRSLRFSREEDAFFCELEKELLQQIPKPKVEKGMYKALYLIAGWVIGGVNWIEEGNAANTPVFPSISDLTLVLTHVPLFLDTIIDFVWRFPPNVNNIKFMGLRCVNNLIEFKQLFIQKLWTGSSPLEQIEWGIDGEALKRKIKKLPQLSELIYLSSADLQKHSLFEGELGKCAENQLRQFPKIKLDVKVEVPEEKEIIQGDLISIKVRMEREHVDEKGKAKLVHAPKWPMAKEENWILILCNVERNLVIELKIIKDQKKVVEEDIKLRLPAGTYDLRLFLKSDSYRGLDQEREVKFKVLVAETEKREKYVHPEDEALDKELPLMQQLLQGMNPKENDSDDELEEDEKGSTTNHNHMERGCECPHDHSE